MLLLLEQLNFLENRHVNVNSGSRHDAVMLIYVASDVNPPNPPRRRADWQAGAHSERRFAHIIHAKLTAQ
jgi:hypothetical protein